MKKRLFSLGLLALFFCISQPAAAMKRKLIYPMHDAAKAGDIERAKKLLEWGCSFTDLDNHGRSPMHIAAIYGQVEFVRFLLGQECNKSTNIQDEWGRTAMFCAVQNNHQKIANYLIRNCKNPPDNEGRKVAYRDGLFIIIDKDKKELS